VKITIYDPKSRKLLRRSQPGTHPEENASLTILDQAIEVFKAFDIYEEVTTFDTDSKLSHEMSLYTLPGWTWKHFNSPGWSGTIPQSHPSPWEMPKI